MDGKPELLQKTLDQHAHHRTNYTSSSNSAASHSRSSHSSSRLINRASSRRSSWQQRVTPRRAPTLAPPTSYLANPVVLVPARPIYIPNPHCQPILQNKKQSGSSHTQSSLNPQSRPRRKIISKRILSGGSISFLLGRLSPLLGTQDEDIIEASAETVADYVDWEQLQAFEHDAFEEELARKEDEEEEYRRRERLQMMDEGKKGRGRPSKIRVGGLGLLASQGGLLRAVITDSEDDSSGADSADSSIESEDENPEPPVKAMLPNQGADSRHVHFRIEIQSPWPKQNPKAPIPPIPPSILDRGKVKIRSEFSKVSEKPKGRPRGRPRIKRVLSVAKVPNAIFDAVSIDVNSKALSAADRVSQSSKNKLSVKPSSGHVQGLQPSYSQNGVNPSLIQRAFGVKMTNGANGVKRPIATAEFREVPMFRAHSSVEEPCLEDIGSPNIANISKALLCQFDAQMKSVPSHKQDDGRTIQSLMSGPMHETALQETESTDNALLKDRSFQEQGNIPPQKKKRTPHSPKYIAHRSRRLLHNVRSVDQPNNMSELETTDVGGSIQVRGKKDDSESEERVVLLRQFQHETLTNSAARATLNLNLVAQEVPGAKSVNWKSRTRNIPALQTLKSQLQTPNPTVQETSNQRPLVHNVSSGRSLNLHAPCTLASSSSESTTPDIDLETFTNTINRQPPPQYQSQSYKKASQTVSNISSDDDDELSRAELLLQEIPPKSTSQKAMSANLRPWIQPSNIKPPTSSLQPPTLSKTPPYFPQNQLFPIPPQSVAHRNLKPIPSLRKSILSPSKRLSMTAPFPSPHLSVTSPTQNVLADISGRPGSDAASFPSDRTSCSAAADGQFGALNTGERATGSWERKGKV